jgi:hypothetical protein
VSKGSGFHFAQSILAQALKKQIARESWPRSKQSGGLVQPVIASTLRTRPHLRTVSHLRRVLRSMLCVLR